jgi:FkbM family methyltransferase
VYPEALTRAVRALAPGSSPVRGRCGQAAVLSADQRVLAANVGYARFADPAPRPMTTSREAKSDASLTPILLEEVMRDAHRYAPGLEPARLTVAADGATTWRRSARRIRERGRDRVERFAALSGFSHRHFDPRASARALGRILALADKFEQTYGRLDDESSRRALLDLLKLRVLGPYHAPLRITAEEFRRRQAYVDASLREQPATYEVSDPWFSPISLYRVPLPDGSRARIHCHSVDIVSVFLLEQYSYRGSSASVTAQAGDVVIDAGGCWGDTALYFASLVGDAGRVYTFEFDPESLEILRANLALNPQLAGRIEVVEQALWDSSGERIAFTQGGRCTTVNGGGDDRSAQAHQVATITLDDFVEQNGIDRVGFIKADVEGSELRLLKGAGHSLHRFAPRLAIAAYHREDDLVRLPQALQVLRPGYRLHLEGSSPFEEETVLFGAAG